MLDEVVAERLGRASAKPSTTSGYLADQGPIQGSKGIELAHIHPDGAAFV
jgi:hypothetical protein